MNLQTPGSPWLRPVDARFESAPPCGCGTVRGGSTTGSRWRGRGGATRAQAIWRARRSGAGGGCGSAVDDPAEHSSLLVVVQPAGLDRVGRELDEVVPRVAEGLGRQAVLLGQIEVDQRRVVGVERHEQ